MVTQLRRFLKMKKGKTFLAEVFWIARRKFQRKKGRKMFRSLVSSNIKRLLQIVKK